MKITEECIACGTCVDACAAGVIVESGEIYAINSDCTKCLACMNVCPVDAIID